MQYVELRNTRFIYATNFAGDPARGYMGNTTRKANIVIPPEKVNELIELGVNVHSTVPHEGEEEGFVPTYHAPIVLSMHPKYDYMTPPEVHLISGEANILLDEETVGRLDGIDVLNVNGTFSVSKKGTLYVEVLYVEQDIRRNPFAELYSPVTGG